MRRMLSAVGLILSLLAAQAAPGRAADAPREPADVEPLLRAEFIPTPHDVVRKMLELAAVGKDDVVYDLGCGDGRIVVAAAKRYGCRAVGVDIDPRRVEESRRNVAAARVDRLVTIERRDMFDVDLRPASVVTLYLGPKLNEELFPQLERLSPGSRIVSHAFEIRGVKPDKIIEVESKQDGRKHALLLWTTPLKRRR